MFTPLILNTKLIREKVRMEDRKLSTNENGAEVL